MGNSPCFRVRAGTAVPVPAGGKGGCCEMPPGHGSFSLFLLDRAGITGGRRLEGSASPVGSEIINVAVGFSWAQLFEKKTTQILLNIVKTSTNNFYTSLHQSTFFPFFCILFLTCDRCFKSWVWVYFCCISAITFKPLSMGDPSQWIFAISNFTPIFWFHFEGGNFVTVYQDPNQTDLYQAHVSHSFSLDLVGMLWFFFPILAQSFVGGLQSVGWLPVIWGSNCV